MNRAVVSAPPPGLAAYLPHRGPPRSGVVVGYDARHKSDVFARDTAEVMAAPACTRTCCRDRCRPRCSPSRSVTSARRGRDGDREPQPAAGQRLQGLPRRRLPDRAARRHRDQRRASRRSAPSRRSPAATTGRRSARTSSTRTSTDCAALVAAGDPARRPRRRTPPMHGVGGDTVLAVLRRAGFPDAGGRTCAGRARTRSSRPSRSRTRRSRARWTWRCAAARHVRRRRRHRQRPRRRPLRRRGPPVPSGGWRMLRGDEVGALLGAMHCVPRAGAATGSYANSIVSSSLLSRIGRRDGLRLRGDPHRLQVDRPGPGPAFGYEEALGVLRRPRARPDKDGVSASLLVVELAAALQAPRAGRCSDRARRPRRASTGCTPPTSCRSASTDLARDRRRDGPAAGRAARPRWPACP